MSDTMDNQGVARNAVDKEPSKTEYVAVNPPLVPPELLGPKKTEVVCPVCRVSVKTVVNYTITTQSEVTLTKCGQGCICWMPATTKITDHYCSKCHRHLGAYVK